jgi:hypothetical protein
MNINEIVEPAKLTLPTIEVGDEIMTGKFKNSKATVKGFTKDVHNQPVMKTTKGDKKVFKDRHSKLVQEGETFQLLGKAWDVTAGYQLASDHNISIDNYDVSDLAGLLGFVKIDRDHASKADLTKPVLMVELEDGIMLIDGYHRVFNAKHNNVEQLPGIILPMEMSLEIEL